MKTQTKILLMIVLAGIMLIGCLPDPVDPNDGQADSDGDVSSGDGDAAATDGDTTITDGDDLRLTISENPNSTLSAIVTVETSEPMQVLLQYEAAGDRVKETGLSPSGTRHKFTVVDMRADTEYLITPMLFDSNDNILLGEAISFHTGSLPDGLPSYTVNLYDSSRLSNGVTIFGVSEKPSPPQNNNNTSASYDGPLFIGVDSEGEVVWYLENTIGGRVGDPDLKLLPDGNLLTFSGDDLRIVTIGGDTLFSLSGSDLGNYRLHHDVVQLPNGHFMGLTQQTQTVTADFADGPIEATGDMIIEFDTNGTIVWSWSSFDHLDTGRFPDSLSQTQGRNGAYDWTHANAIVYRESDDSVLISLRHQNWLVKIDHTTGDILWRLGTDGDFTITNDDMPETDAWFYSQHAPEWQDDGSLLLYDNGTSRPGLAAGEAYSRGALYRIDEQAVEAELIWQHRVDTYTSFLGDADRLENGNVLLCAGGVMSDREQASLIEVSGDTDSDPIWELAVSDYTIYRATKLSSFYHDTMIADLPDDNEFDEPADHPEPDDRPDDTDETCSLDCSAVAACPPDAALGCVCMVHPQEGERCVPACEDDGDCPTPPDRTLVCSPDHICVPQGGRPE